MSGDNFSLAGFDSGQVEPIIQKLAEEDILGQLLRREGRMADLGSEAGEPKLDWVDGLEKALSRPEWLAQCEMEGFEILKQGMRHVIWAGMGGSVQAVYVLKRFGLLDSPFLHIYPCDSTDPASLNRILRRIEREEQTWSPSSLQERTMMIGVSMGMTSEEPITHLEWFDGLLSQLRIEGREHHIQVMTLPGSYLDLFAEARNCRRVPIQLDGENRTPGRMSAPATRVFIRPAALRLLAETMNQDPDRRPDGSLLRAVLQRAQDLYGLSWTMSEEARRAFTGSNPFVQLGAVVAERARAGKNQVALAVSAEWSGFEPWLEQLVEESLGKEGKGFCIFYGDQDWKRLSTEPLVLGLGTAKGTDIQLQLPKTVTLTDRLGVLGGLFAGFKLTVATFGYLHDIVFAGQPAVEGYKAYARKYRDAPGDVPFTALQRDSPAWESLCLDISSLARGGVTPELDRQIALRGGDPHNAADVLAAVLALRARKPGALRYVDFTFNGEMPETLASVFEQARRTLANERLAIPAKIRTGPSDYHSTEQSEVDGPDELVSIRFVAYQHEAPVAGRYSDKFLLAQARGTQQAMEDSGRWVVMVTFPELNPETVNQLGRFFDAVSNKLDLFLQSMNETTDEHRAAHRNQKISP